MTNLCSLPGYPSENSFSQISTLREIEAASCAIVEIFSCREATHGHFEQRSGLQYQRGNKWMIMAVVTVATLAVSFLDTMETLLIKYFYWNKKRIETKSIYFCTTKPSTAHINFEQCRLILPWVMPSEPSDSVNLFLQDTKSYLLKYRANGRKPCSEVSESKRWALLMSRPSRIIVLGQPEGNQVAYHLWADVILVPKFGSPSIDLLPISTAESSSNLPNGAKTEPALSSMTLKKGETSWIRLCLFP